MKLEAKNLTKKYGDFTAVNSIDLKIESGKILGLLGPNGAGKSTVIKMLSGQIQPTAGEILLDGKKYKAVPEELRGNIGVMPQDIIIWDHLTTYENILFTGRLQNLANAELKARAEELMLALHLNEERNTLAKNLSGGFKRRLNLAISIVHKPSLLFLDEPTPGIDPQNRRFLWEFINSLRGNENYSVVLTDHYLEEAEKVSDYVVILDHGKVVASGTVNELKQNFGSGKVVQVEFDLKTKENEINFVWKNISNKFDDAKLSGNLITIVSNNYGSTIKYCIEILDSKNIAYNDISIKEPSLEDIFLLLTGKNIRE